MRPKYKVGEEILLCSEQAPHLNGAYVVKNIKLSFYGEIVYNIGVMNDNGDEYWRENVLRKKHTPSELSFNELMSTLGASGNV